MRIVVERPLVSNSPITTLDTFTSEDPLSVWMKIGDSGALTIHSGIPGNNEMIIKAYSPGHWVNAKVE